MPRIVHPASAYKLSLGSRNGAKIALTGYVEVEMPYLSTAADGDHRLLQWCMNVSSLKPKFTKGAHITLRQGNASNDPLNADTLVFANATHMGGQYRQYKVDKIEVSVASNDLAHPLIFQTDRGNSNVIPSVQDALTGAHKAISLSEGRKTCKYGFTASKAPGDQQFRSANTVDGATVGDADAVWIKCVQRVDRPFGLPNGVLANGETNFAEQLKVMRHTIAVKAFITMRDAMGN